VEDRSIDRTKLDCPRSVDRSVPIHSDRSGLEIFEIFGARGRALRREESLPIRREARWQEVRMPLSGARDGADHLGSKYLVIGGDICDSPKWEYR
jgi:hypothetical protein